eukprot:CAMPEP_0202978380 /NCGR_PEP_ID=MMETSP1396-20130829/84822_1 /ASSEMBLY_ACC=CAM_ASM_000872 /TAXON_ID= /ORGANISM="Pseudokeronopsis sp., Strain Brazil" /LENGTH=263 /DNA_ID=CAMNT_0049717329 /DNA_START=747 /DNA_END=1539 /DNA_ORIENTATION=+
MTESLTIPFFGYSDDVQIDKLIKLRKEMQKVHKSLTLLPFFIKALSLAMVEFPQMNLVVNPDVDAEGYIKEYVIKKDHNFSIAMDTKDGLSYPSSTESKTKASSRSNPPEYVIKKNHNFSIAMDTKDGLSVPIVHRVQDKSILQIQSAISDLRTRLDNGQLTAKDYEGPTFSVSSVGNIGGSYFVPTILRPQGAIIAIGKAKPIALYQPDPASPEGYKFVPSQQLGFSICADHRVIEGAYAVKFGQRFKAFLEDPNLMLISMS